ncbi:VanZ family protein [Saccharothrix australiensis]|uniref:VanZ family protein n=1 Tax=Saccharothrix australiensis TaxID=2072 RepID=UPI001FE4FB42|nr:VanZ family protein [Saccharothrix australiensis]
MRMSETIIAFILFALVVPLAALPWVHLQYRRYGQLRGWSAVVAAAGVLYGCGLVAFTLFPLPAVTPDFCLDRHLLDTWQLRPFASLDDVLREGRAALSQVLLNVVLFVPLGFLLRYRFGRGLPAATAVGLLTSLCVELVQGTAILGLYPCPYRLADVDDLVTNTLGCVLGWLLARWAGRLLPPAVPEPSADLAPPGLLRRGLAFAGDLLTIGLTQSAVQVVLALTGGRPRELTTTDWFGVALGAAVLVAYTLLVPLLRADRATPGQVVFHLAVVGRGGGPASRGATVVRFAAWWLPVLLLAATGRTGLVLVLAALLGLLARLRADRRGLPALVSRTRTVTRAAYERGVAADR